jgi:hypothetical protein
LRDSEAPAAVRQHDVRALGGSPERRKLRGTATNPAPCPQIRVGVPALEREFLVRSVQQHLTSGPK